MIFSSTVQYVSFFLSFTMTSAMLPRPMAGRAILNGTSTSSSSSAFQSTATTSSVDLSTVTAAPTSSYIYSDPNCATAASVYCRVDVGTVQVHFWPTGAQAGNHTYPSTVSLPGYNYTMTSPSVYFVINKMYATDACHSIVGPILTNFVTGYPLSLVSTLAPYANSALTATRINNSTMQLQLSDLSTNCPLSTSIPHDNHNVGNNGCNAVFAYDNNLKSAAGNAWEACGRHAGGQYGIYDPPVPVQPCLNNNCGDAGAGSAATTTAAIEPTPPVADLKGPTSSVGALPSPIISSGPSSTALVVPTVSTASEPPASETPSRDGNAPGNQASITPSSASTPTSIIIAPSEQLSVSPQPEITSSAQEILPSSIPAAVITLANSAVISATAGASSIVIGSQTVYANSAPITVSGQGLVSLAPSGLVISNSANGVISTYSLPIPVPTAIITQIYTYAGQSISIAGFESSKVVVGSQTLTVGGEVATLSGNQVVSLASSGSLVIQAPGGEVTTIPVQISTSSGLVGGGQSLATGLPSGNASSTVASTTSIGAIIYSTFQGEGRRSMELGILNWISCAIFGVMFILR